MLFDRAGELFTIRAATVAGSTIAWGLSDGTCAAIALWSAAADLDDVCLHILNPAGHVRCAPDGTVTSVEIGKYGQRFMNAKRRS